MYLDVQPYATGYALPDGCYPRRMRRHGHVTSREEAEMRRTDADERSGSAAVESVVLIVLFALIGVALVFITLTIADQLQGLSSTITQALNTSPAMDVGAPGGLQ